jgi:hypothetical protein
VLEVEPDLGEQLEPADLEKLREMAVAEVLTLEAGCWREPRDGVSPVGNLGLLVSRVCSPAG